MPNYYVSWLSVQLGARVICVNVNEFQLIASFLGLLLVFVSILIFFMMDCLRSYLLFAYFLRLSSSYCLLQPCVPAWCSVLLAKFFVFCTSRLSHLYLLSLIIYNMVHNLSVSIIIILPFIVLPSVQFSWFGLPTYVFFHKNFFLDLWILR